MTRNETFTKMGNSMIEWEMRKKTREQERQRILEAQDWESPDLNRLWEEQERDPFPYTRGESKAYWAWKRSFKEGSEELEMDDFLFENEVSDFIRTLRQAGITTMLYTNTSTAVMQNLHGFVAEGCRMLGLCTIERPDQDWRHGPVQGIRFELN